MELVLPSATAKGVKIFVSSDNEPALALCDATRIRQVVWNLLSTAIKFTPTGGEVEITLRRVQSQAEIKVCDNGIGIKPEFLPYVFERFRQADSSHTRQHGGLGLGLSIVSHIVDMHGGQISAASNGEGQGATFTVLLPLLEESDIPEEAPPSAGVRAPDVLKNVSVLVVDDEADVREMITLILKQRGAQVRSADSAARALEMLHDWHPDVLLFDITMPEMNGQELLLRVRSLPYEMLRKIPALVLSANATEPDRQRSREAGFARHLDKPIHGDELVQAISEVLKRA
jgi:CheY-like chemotaxis protein